MRIFSAVLALGLWAARLGAQTVTPHDISQIRLARDVRLSPDARRLAFAISEPAGSQRETRRSDIWTIATLAGDTPHLLISGGDDNSPRWSPDGKTLAFLSTRGEGSPGAAEATSQIYRVSASGPGSGAPERLTSIPGEVDDFAWSPDGRFIAFTVHPPALEEDPVVVGRNEQPTRLGILNVAERKTALLTGEDLDVQALAWSPDGGEIALVVAPGARPEDQIRLALVVVSRSTGAVVRRLSENVGMASALRWSPDGRFITFFECPPERGFASWTAVVPAAGGPVRPIRKDRPSSTLRAEWAADSRRLILLTVEGTAQAIWDLDLESGREKRVAQVVNSQAEFGFSTDGTTTVFLGQTSQSPTDIWMAASGQPARRLTDLNPQTRGWRLGAVQTIQWKNSKDGLDRKGVLITPAGYAAGRAYPTVVLTHPGDLPWWTGWHATWWAWGQLLASRGYVVFLPNTRGVTGEGRKMNDAIGDWGGLAYQDLVDGVDALVQRGIADPERLGIGGWSNGGFMTEWAITHTTRFRAAIALAGHSDFFSLYGTSYGRVPLQIALGDPYADRSVYDERSPIHFIRSCKTPTLILHGANDQGVPVSQGYELYTALQKLGVESEMVVYPREGHSIRERGHQEDLQKRVLAWFDRHLQGATPAP